MDPTDCDEKTECDMGRSVSRAFDSLYERCKLCVEAGINMVLINIFISFVWFFMVSVRELNSYTVKTRGGPNKIQYLPTAA
jgi:hypothetical protein